MEIDSETCAFFFFTFGLHWDPTGGLSLHDISSVSADQWGRGDIMPVKAVVPGVKAAWVRFWQLLLPW